MATAQEALSSMVTSLETKTGRSIDAWKAVAHATGATTHGKIVAALKADHRLTHGYANLVAHLALGSDAVSQEAGGTDLVAEQYAGAKAGLRPIYDALMARLEAFGPDVEVSPKKAYVSLRRLKQFALIQPSTSTRLDVGLNLKGVAPMARLEASGSFNAMCTHRVRVATLAEADDELIGWLKDAYDRA